MICPLSSHWTLSGINCQALELNTVVARLIVAGDQEAIFPNMHEKIMIDQ